MYPKNWNMLDAAGHEFFKKNLQGGKALALFLKDRLVMTEGYQHSSN